MFFTLCIIKYILIIHLYASSAYSRIVDFAFLNLTFHNDSNLMVNIHTHVEELNVSDPEAFIKYRNGPSELKRTLNGIKPSCNYE